MVILLVLLLLAGAPAAAEEVQAPPPDIVFPVAAPVTWRDTFSEPRGEYLHEAQDLMGEKLAPVVAAHAGQVRWIGNIEQVPGGHYYISIEADDGWTTSYVHLNNDTPGTDDGRGGMRWAYAPGVREGARVGAGQFIGYLGDSGNAEDAGPHLHFEMRRPDSSAFNPYEMLLRAPRLIITPESMINGVSTALGVMEPSMRWSFAEGYTAEAFDTFLLLGNPLDATATATITLLPESASPVPVIMEVAPRARATLRVDDVIPADSVAATVEATAPVVAERATYFRSRGAVDGSASEAVREPSAHWYLAEGYTGPGFETWLLVANALTREVPARVRFLPGHSESVELTMTLPASSRTTFRVDNWVPSDDVAETVDALDGSDLVAERAVYVAETVGRNGGAVAPGTPSLSTDWFFAEGSTEPGVETWLLLANPSTDTASASIRFLGTSGPAGDITLTVPPASRRTVDVGNALAAYSGDLGVVVTATVPLAVERAVYHPQGATASQGGLAQSTSWYFAEGYVGGGFGTTFAVANANRSAASVVIRLDAPGGVTSTVAGLSVPALSRRTVDVRSLAIAHPEFSAFVTSTIPVTVERTETFGYLRSQEDTR